VHTKIRCDRDVLKRKTDFASEGRAMAAAALAEFRAAVMLSSSFVEVYYLLRELAECLHKEDEKQAVCVHHWMEFLVSAVRDNSNLTLGHGQQHYASMPWDECRHCITRSFGPTEYEALEEAVERMFELAG
jgi:hypothetical protein